ncbi:SGNH/GDSL hydrolase family protein [Winogradskyella eckloniae]|uniref:SGNH/GDSL hydrolase family protein n=1 Tax=Winogradskyella eckloniae TaxID=1089306 RepID=UPI0015670388|nr:SGNH/GDSL hydrolase family protein [Winogradskyella eckloniae]NRD18553.1 SGNH/GDSL hydrolase family protein [Winogradskyella eckloniae]
MKSYFFILICILGITTACKSEKKSDLSTPKIELALNGKRVLILGNSITQNGRYVDFLEYYIRKQYPKNQLDIISIGLSGETISGTTEEGREFPRPNVRHRLDKALNEIKPDVVIACYGMNDGNYSPLDSLRFDAYKNGILELKTKTTAINAELILMTPTIFDPNPIKDRLSKEGDTYEYWHPYFKYNDVLEAYSNWLLSIETEALKVVDLHHHLDSKLTAMQSIKSDSTFIPDGVHPNTIGHFYMAQKILKDLYPEISIENPMTEIDRLEADSLYNLVLRRRELRSDGWRYYIGYTSKEKLYKTDSILPIEMEVEKLDLAIETLLN